MILVDTDVISALAKIDRLSLLLTLFKRSYLSITPGVLAELTHSLTMPCIQLSCRRTDST